MKKTLLLLLLSFTVSVISVNAQEYHLGQVVENPDGSLGVVFYLNEDGTNGWMVALHDASINCPWGPTGTISGINDITVTNSDYLTSIFLDFDGYDYTQRIREYCENNGYTNPYAAGLVDFENGWYLPSAGQLKWLYVNAIFYEPALQSVGEKMGLHGYWSSSLQSDEKAWYVQFGAPYPETSWASNGYFGAIARGNYYDEYGRSLAVRAVRDLDFSPIPAIGQLQTPNVICGTGPIELVLPHLNHIDSYGWEISADENFLTPTPYTGQYLDEIYDGWYLRLWAIAGDEMLYSNVVRISAHNASTSHQYVQSCEPYEWGGQILTQSGIYQQFLENQWGCDSIATLNLSINEIIEFQFMDIGCNEYDWNGQILTESGVYQQILPSANGCDSIVTLYLNVKHTPPVSEIDGETIIYYNENGEYTYSIEPVPGCFGYEWSINNHWQISPNGNECSVNINTANAGILKVKVYTECGFVERTITIHHDYQPSLVIYPNPTQSDFNMVLSGMKGKAIIEIHDYLGQLIDSFSLNTEVDGLTIPYSLQDKAAGIYFISVTNNFNVITKKLVKTAAAVTGYGY